MVTVDDEDAGRKNPRKTCRAGLAPCKRGCMDATRAPRTTMLPRRTGEARIVFGMWLTVFTLPADKTTLGGAMIRARCTDRPLCLNCRCWKFAFADGGGVRAGVLDVDARYSGVTCNIGACTIGCGSTDCTTGEGGFTATVADAAAAAATVAAATAT